MTGDRSQSNDVSWLRRMMRARPVASFIIGLLTASFLTAALAEMLHTQLGLNEIYSMGAAYAALGLALTLFGFWLRNNHGGFAVFIGLIILICAVLLPAMYTARPELFPPLPN
jgi:hypothetical protein